MELITYYITLFLHLDKYLSSVIQEYGFWTHLILFCIIFCETGLVVTPFLPGDSLLFATGTFAARGALDLTVVLALLSVAAIVGDTINYWFGFLAGPRCWKGKKTVGEKRIPDRTHQFYEKYGGKTIILARFIPIIRTFAPFVAVSAL
jgi:membrane-associated protein